MIDESQILRVDERLSGSIEQLRYRAMLAVHSTCSQMGRLEQCFGSGMSSCSSLGSFLPVIKIPC
jgi:hypothetical protein